MAWGDRSCIQQFVLIVSIIAVLCTLASLAANIATMVKASKEGWYSRCTKEKPRSADWKCCQDCNTKDAVFFYILRVYTSLFCIMAILAEIPGLDWYRDFFRVFSYFWGRGFLQVFVGFLTVTGNVAPDDPTAGDFAAIIGYILIAVGFLHFILACLCFKEYSGERRKTADGYTATPATPAAI